MGWLDDLFGKQMQQDGTNVPQRKVANFKGCIVKDNPTTGATDITPLGGGGFGDARISVSAQSNSGVSAYPAASAQAVGISTFVRLALADHDAIRFPNDADDIIPLTIGLQGRVQNNTSFVIDLYPPVGEQIAVDGVQLGDGVPVELPPFASLAWMLDLDGTFYVF